MAIPSTPEQREAAMQLLAALGADPAWRQHCEDEARRLHESIRSSVLSNPARYGLTPEQAALVIEPIKP